MTKLIESIAEGRILLERVAIRSGGEEPSPLAEDRERLKERKWGPHPEKDENAGQPKG